MVEERYKLTEFLDFTLGKLKRKFTNQELNEITDIINCYKTEYISERIEKFMKEYNEN